MCYKKSSRNLLLEQSCWIKHETFEIRSAQKLWWNHDDYELYENRKVL